MLEAGRQVLQWWAVRTDKRVDFGDEIGINETWWLHLERIVLRPGGEVLSPSPQMPCRGASKEGEGPPSRVRQNEFPACLGGWK